MKGNSMSDKNPFAGLGDGARSNSGPDGDQYAYPQSNEPRPAPRPPESPAPQQAPYQQYPNQQQGQYPAQQYPGQQQGHAYPGQHQTPPQYPGYPGGQPPQAYPNQVQNYPGPGQHHPQPGYGQNQFGPAPYGQGPYAQGYPSQKSRVVAGLLGVFLGAFGVHRFYLGNSGIGAAQVVATVFTGGFAGVWGFVEGIMILCNAQPFRTDARGIPLKG